MDTKTRTGTFAQRCRCPPSIDVADRTSRARVLSLATRPSPVRCVPGNEQSGLAMLRIPIRTMRLEYDMWMRLDVVSEPKTPCCVSTAADAPPVWPRSTNAMAQLPHAGYAVPSIGPGANGSARDAAHTYPRHRDHCAATSAVDTPHAVPQAQANHTRAFYATAPRLDAAVAQPGGASASLQPPTGGHGDLYSSTGAYASHISAGGDGGAANATLPLPASGAVHCAATTAAGMVPLMGQTAVPSRDAHAGAALPRYGGGVDGAARPSVEVRHTSGEGHASRGVADAGVALSFGANAAHTHTWDQGHAVSAAAPQAPRAPSQMPPADVPSALALDGPNPAVVQPRVHDGGAVAPAPTRTGVAHGDIDRSAGFAAIALHGYDLAELRRYDTILASSDIGAMAQRTTCVVHAPRLSERVGGVGRPAWCEALHTAYKGLASCMARVVVLSPSRAVAVDAMPFATLKGMQGVANARRSAGKNERPTVYFETYMGLSSDRYRSRNYPDVEGPRWNAAGQTAYPRPQLCFLALFIEDAPREVYEWLAKLPPARVRIVWHTAGGFNAIGLRDFFCPRVLRVPMVGMPFMTPPCLLRLVPVRSTLSEDQQLATLLRGLGEVADVFAGRLGNGNSAAAAGESARPQPQWVPHPDDGDAQHARLLREHVRWLHWVFATAGRHGQEGWTPPCCAAKPNPNLGLPGMLSPWGRVAEQLHTAFLCPTPWQNTGSCSAVNHLASQVDGLRDAVQLCLPPVVDTHLNPCCDATAAFANVMLRWSQRAASGLSRGRTAFLVAAASGVVAQAVDKRGHNDVLVYCPHTKELAGDLKLHRAFHKELQGRSRGPQGNRARACVVTNSAQTYTAETRPSELPERNPRQRVRSERAKLHAERRRAGPARPGVLVLDMPMSQQRPKKLPERAFSCVVVVCDADHPVSSKTVLAALGPVLPPEGGSVECHVVYDAGAEGASRGAGFALREVAWMTEVWQWRMKRDSLSRPVAPPVGASPSAVMR